MSLSDVATDVGNENRFSGVLHALLSGCLPCYIAAVSDDQVGGGWPIDCVRFMMTHSNYYRGCVPLVRPDF